MYEGNQIRLARHLVDHLNARPVGDFGSEGTDFCARCDFDAHQRGQPDASFTNGVPSNGPVFLEFPHVGADGAFARSNLLGQVHVGDAAVGAKGGKDGSVNFGDAGHGT